MNDALHFAGNQKSRLTFQRTDFQRRLFLWPIPFLFSITAVLDQTGCVALDRLCRDELLLDHRTRLWAKLGGFRRHLGVRALPLLSRGGVCFFVEADGFEAGAGALRSSGLFVFNLCFYSGSV